METEVTDIVHLLGSSTFIITKELVIGLLGIALNYCNVILLIVGLNFVKEDRDSCYKK